MASIQNIKPINTKILFDFLEKVENHGFSRMSNYGLQIVESKEGQVGKHRWGKVLAIGNDIDPSDVDVGEYILIEALGWTEGMKITDDDDKKYWFTDLDKVMCVSSEMPDLN